VPTHQRQRIAHCDRHLFPPLTGFIDRLTHLDGCFRPAANLPAAGRTCCRPLYLKTPSR
jgi:hypothetical protein